MKIYKKIKEENRITHYLLNIPFLKYEKYNTYKIYNIFGKKIFIHRQKKIIYKIKSEVQFIKKHYNNIDFSDIITIKEIIKGLDSNSIETVFHILKRIQAVKTSSQKRIAFNFFTPEEKEKLLKFYLYQDYHKAIVLSENLFLKQDKFLPINNFSDSLFYYKHGLPTLSKKIQENIKDKNIIDVGGFIGDSSLVFQEWHPKTIYSFEANPNTLKTFKKTIELNSLENVKIVEKALGDKEGEIYIQGMIIEEKPTPSNSKIIITTLDKYTTENKIKDIALIKVDIEGYEQPFLHGSYNTIKEHKPILLLSIYHNWSDFIKIKPLIESWDLGYTFKIHKPVDGSIVIDTLLICIPPHLS